MPKFRAAREVAKTVYFRSATFMPLLKRRLRYLSEAEAVIVLNLHRVAPDDASMYRPLSPDYFRQLVDFCMAHFRVTDFAGLNRNYSGAQLVLSFDDGYADFYEHAVPILRERGIRVNQNIIPACVDSGLPPLNVVAQDFIGQAPRELVERIDIPGFEKTVSRDISIEVSRFIKYLPSSQRAAMESYLLDQFRSWEEFVPTPMMSLEQIRDVADTHEIGAHSYSHASLAIEDESFAADDAKACKQWFAENLSLDPDIYAVPNGSYRPEQLEAITEQGFSRILLVDERLNTKADIRSATLKRLTFDALSEAEIYFRAVGKTEKVAS